MANPARPIVDLSSIVDFSWIRVIAVSLASALSFGSASAGAAPIAQAGTSASSAQSISVAKISPSVAAAVAAGGIAFPAEVTLSGQNFRPGATVNIGSHAAGVISVSAMEIRATAPGGPAGTVDVTVTNPDGTSATLSKAFTYTTGPVVYGISPQSGSSAQPTFTLPDAFTWTREPSATPAAPPAPVSNNGPSAWPPRPGS
jgi:IPT/TIG domain